MFGEIRAYRNAGVERLQVQRASSSLPAFYANRRNRYASVYSTVLGVAAKFVLSETRVDVNLPI